MARKTASWNPLAFVPFQVTLIASAVYIALGAFLLYTHHHVPSAPSDPTPVEGLNLTQAWLDLSFVSDGFHPIDSRRNEAVREYLVQRVEKILEVNGAEWKGVKQGADGPVNVEGKGKDKKGKKDGKGKRNRDEKKEGPRAVTVFEDFASNVTFVDDFRRAPWTCYQESTNVMIYVRGENDKEGDWWEENGTGDAFSSDWGVLVNAHYDSVSSGYGATDDGVGVITLLQLISYFTREGNRPDRGIVFLFNNGEENGLYGAHNYLRHPLSHFTHTFLNLEGAGAGGRAVLFRSTDAEVTRFYSGASRPYGSVVFDDGFKRGLVASGTDYSVFHGDSGMRGLDVAFFEPRSRYHTDQDDARNTSPDSVWHMISTALDTTKAMVSYTGEAFDGPTMSNGRVDIGHGSNGVWFDVFNRTFALLKLPTLFALSVTLLVAAPVILIVLQIVLVKGDKWYPLTKKQYLHSSDDEPVHFSGMRGLFRFPIAFIVATAGVFALAYLLTKINPYIIYSSEYAVWTMMLSAYFSIAWFFLGGADRVRPTALHRMFVLIWLFALSWVILVAVTVGENNYQIASGYLMVVFNACVFVALLISYLELFALPKKSQYVERMSGVGTESSRPVSRSSRDVLNAGEGRSRSRRGADDEEEDANERTSLLRGRDSRGGNTFKGVAKRATGDDEVHDEEENELPGKVYGEEQAWSSSLPRWTWIVQFLVLVPINLILIGQVALLTTSALHQTPADGSSVLTIYLLLAVLTTLLLLPLTPFLHRFVYQLPTFLFFLFVGCLIYNLLAFPFSRDARLKIFFTQSLDLDTNINNVTLTGLDGYVQDVIGELPSSTGKNVQCNHATEDPLRKGLRSCSWNGLPPNVVPGESTSFASSKKNHTSAPVTSSWLSYNLTHNGSTASFSLRGRNTKACRLTFHDPVSDVHIEDAASDPRYKTTTRDGSTEIRLFSREWEKTWRVNVTWSGGGDDDGGAKGRQGKVMCLWSDINVHGAIPAYDELRRFAPVWAAGTKGGDGLVEGWKAFKV